MVIKHHGPFRCLGPTQAFWKNGVVFIDQLRDSWWYCWWTKSCTTKDDDYHIFDRVLTIPGGAGFCPSTVDVSNSILSCLDQVRNVYILLFALNFSPKKNMLVKRKESHKYHLGSTLSHPECYWQIDGLGCNSGAQKSKNPCGDCCYWEGGGSSNKYGKKI